MKCYKADNITDIAKLTGIDKETLTGWNRDNVLFTVCSMTKKPERISRLLSSDGRIRIKNRRLLRLMSRASR